MSIQEIAGLDALPHKKGYYVRLMSDPRLLQHGTTGDVFALRSGKEWEADGYKMVTEIDNTVSIKVAHNLTGERKKS